MTQSPDTESAAAPELPLRLVASRLKWTLLLLLSMVFVAGGIWLAPENAIMGYGCAILFGLGAVMASMNLLPNASFLLIETSGFSISTAFRRHFVAWSDVAEFVPAEVAANRTVGWNFTAEYAKAKRIRAVNTALAGAQAALPDTYGKSADELLELLESCRVRYGSKRPASHG